MLLQVLSGPRRDHHVYQIRLSYIISEIVKPKEDGVSKTEPSFRTVYRYLD